MNVKVCDLCNCRMIDEPKPLKVTVRQKWYSFQEEGWGKLDVCVDCKRAILELSYKKRKERENDKR